MIIRKSITQGNEWNKIYTAPDTEKITHVRVTNNTNKDQIVTLGISRTGSSIKDELATATISTIPFISRLPGVNGNDISIELIDPGIAGDLSISVTGTAITITLASDGAAITSTVGDVVSAIQGNTDANNLVYISTADIPSLTATATATSGAVNLSGGVTGTFSYYIFKDYTVSGNSWVDFDTVIDIGEGESLFVITELPLVDISIDVE